MRIAVCLGMILIGGTTGHAAESKRDRKQIEEITRLQIFLDNSNFGPGKIDGKDGEFTRKAIKLFRRSQGKQIQGGQILAPHRHSRNKSGQY